MNPEKETSSYFACSSHQLVNKGKIITEYWIGCTTFSDWRKAQDASFQLEEINGSEMLSLGARSWTVAKLVTQAWYKNYENNESAKIKEVDKSSTASSDLVIPTQGSSRHNGKRHTPGRVAEKGKGNRAECPHHRQLSIPALQASWECKESSATTQHSTQALQWPVDSLWQNHALDRN